MTIRIENAAAALGRLGGASRSEAKIAAARENGKKGGRPPVKRRARKPSRQARQREAASE